MGHAGLSSTVCSTKKELPWSLWGRGFIKKRLLFLFSGIGVSGVFGVFGRAYAFFGGALGLGFGV